MSKKRTLRSSILWLLAVILLSVGGYIVAVRMQGNFHVITPSEAYRSAQLDDGQLTDYAKRYNIKSVLNLRGQHSGESWYDDEIAMSRRLDLAHYDVGLSSDHELTPAEVGQLMDIFRTAPRPILIHCQAGADRSGLVAAMWKVAVDKEPKAEAGKQLSIKYGHMPFGENQAMDRFFEKWNP
jgi:protein tyrosine/serine phosphatase